MRGRALLIATSRYSDERLPELSSAVLDAKGLKDVLADSRIGDFAVEVCLDSPCDHVRKRIGDFFAEAARDDLLLLYLSGHGVKDQAGRLWFPTTDTNQDRLLYTAIAAGYINEAANLGKSRRVVMIFDACFSGAFVRGWELKAGSQVNVEESFRASTGSFVITASNAIQYAHARAGQPSLFSKHLIAGLRTGEADLNGDGDVGVEELHQYVKKQVQREQSDQEPLCWAFGVDGDLVVAANPEPLPGKLPEDIRKLMDSPLASGRLAAVAELERLLADPSRPTALGARQALQWLQANDNRTVSEAAGAALSRAGGAPGRGQAGTSGSRPPGGDTAGRPGRHGPLLLAGSVAAVLVVAAVLGRHVFLGGSGHSHQDRPVSSAHASSEPAQRPAAAQAALSASASASEGESGASALASASASPQETRVPHRRESRKHRTFAQRSPTPSAAPALPSLASIRPGTVFHDCKDCLEMVWVPTGSFQMGSPPDEEGRFDNEGPVHTVTIDYPLAVSEYPVTRGQWRQYLTSKGKSGSRGCFAWKGGTLGLHAQYSWSNPGFEQQDDHPVVCVSWHEANDYALWLSEKTGKRYRLLSEAEYELVSRALSDTAFVWGDDVKDACRYANVADAAAKARYPGWTTVSCDDGYAFTSPVERFPKSRFGLYDISGNVQSWTADCYHDSYAGAPTDGDAWISGDCSRRVLRGASWFNVPSLLRAATRSWRRATDSLNYAGFRLARTE